MVFDRLVECGAVHLSLDRPAHVCDLFGPFTYQGHQQVGVWVVCRDTGGDLLEQNGLPCLWRGDYECALAAANGRDQIDESGGELLRRGGEGELIVGVYGRETVEPHTLARRYGVVSVNDFDSHQVVVALVFLWGPYLTGDHVTLSKPKSIYLGLGDVDVFMPVYLAGCAQETVSVVQDVEYACAEELVTLGRQAGEQFEYEVGAPCGDSVLQIGFKSDGPQFVHRPCAELPQLGLPVGLRKFGVGGDLLLSV